MTADLYAINEIISATDDTTLRSRLASAHRTETDFRPSYQKRIIK